MQYPEQVQLLHDALSRLPSVFDISSGLESVVGLDTDDLSFPNLAICPMLPYGVQAAA